MANFAMILICLLLGLLLRRSRKFPAQTPQALNGFVIFVSLPALVVIQMGTLFKTVPWQADLLWPVSLAWLWFAMAWGFIGWLGPRLGWGPRITGALALTAGLGNTSFVGFPLLEALIGPEALPLGVLVDQPGTFLVLATVGLLVATLYGTDGQTHSWRRMLKHVACFPPFLALLVSFALALSGAELPSFLWTVLERLSQTLVPLALTSVGFQLKFDPLQLRRHWRPLVLGLSSKLLLAPLLAWAFYGLAFGQRGLVGQVIILEAAMAPMITASVVAADAGLDGDLANLMVGLGIPLSLLTVPAWSWMLG